jgi:hypothetical protein
VKVFEGPSTFETALEAAKATKIAEAERKRKIQKANFGPSAVAKSARHYSSEIRRAWLWLV